MARSSNSTPSLMTGKPRRSSLQPSYRRARRPATTQAITLAITSGKGGVGKSNITINLAITLAQQGAKVCIFDADTNLANINILMGISPQYNIEHLLNGEKTLDEIMISGPANIRIIPASSGLASLTDIDKTQQTRLIHALQELERRFDYVLIDTAAGIDSPVTRFLRAADAVLLIITTEPTSLTDAFALLRVLKRNGYQQTTHVVVNMAINYGDGMEAFTRFNGAVKKYLNMTLRYAGYITDDIAVKESVRQQCPVVLYRPEALATRCFINLKKTLVNHLPTVSQSNKFSAFWQALLTPKHDGVETAHINRKLSNKPAQPSTIRQGILNAIDGSQLNNADLLAIMLALSSDINTTAQADPSLASIKNQQRLGYIIDKLQRSYQGKPPENAVQKWQKTITRLSSSGNELEQRLDKLILDLEEILD